MFKESISLPKCEKCDAKVNSVRTSDLCPLSFFSSFQLCIENSRATGLKPKSSKFLLNYDRGIGKLLFLSFFLFLPVILREHMLYPLVLKEKQTNKTRQTILTAFSKHNILVNKPKIISQDIRSLTSILKELSSDFYLFVYFLMEVPVFLLIFQPLLTVFSNVCVVCLIIYRLLLIESSTPINQKGFIKYRLCTWSSRE